MTPTADRRAEQLRSWSRYLAVLADELDALASGDNVAALGVAEERERIEHELQAYAGSMAEADGVLETSPAELLAELVDAALRERDERLLADQLLRNRFQDLQDGTLPRARGITNRYGWGGRYSATSSADPRLDRRF